MERNRQCGYGTAGGGTCEQTAGFLEEQLPSLMQFGMKVIFALVVFFIGRFLIQWVRRIVRGSLERSGRTGEWPSS